MAPRFLTILTGRNLPKITGQSGEPEPSIINEKTVADFTRVVEQTGILKQELAPGKPWPRHGTTPSAKGDRRGARCASFVPSALGHLSGYVPKGSAFLLTGSHGVS
jgi:hypothetical protein